MNSREEFQKKENLFLSPKAVLSKETRGRSLEEKECTVRTPFQRDRDRIIHSKAFRRLKHKTQVFIAPEFDHYRTRLTHTLEVAQISRTIGRALALNEDLIEAIALGHDLGHTPFGHSGEEALNNLVEEGFHHNRQSLRVVEKLETRRGGRRGLNLTIEVKEGILGHTGEDVPSSLEGQIVRIADRVAYINHDIDDAIRGGIISKKDLPSRALKVLGSDHSLRINTMVRDLIQTSIGKNTIEQSSEIQKTTDELRNFLFERVYLCEEARREKQKVRDFIQGLFRQYKKYPEEMPAEYQELIDEWGKNRVIADYIAGMSDRFALSQGENLLFPRQWFPG